MEVLSKRAELYKRTKELNPKRWVNSKVRDWSLTWREHGPHHREIDRSLVKVCLLVLKYLQ
ncbi:unnamed protein product [Acidithrix sp. C25]|nr:unnamed protein product [Acidithrix sp. C25]CAG4912398.1 unnamed protein product [Acidithrix sp. C25]